MGFLFFLQAFLLIEKNPVLIPVQSWIAHLNLLQCDQCIFQSCNHLAEEERTGCPYFNCVLVVVWVSVSSSQCNGMLCDCGVSCHVRLFLGALPTAKICTNNPMVSTKYKVLVYSKCVPLV